ncbi:g12709 [Coccomyxa viridis]|uniref:G12709 protein n=1 Tax=Coccomyxa viridis TaxID=1274662 RepID=A0ABP1GF50_9CHLO
MSALSNNLRLVGSQRFSETVCLPHQRPAVFNHKLSIPQARKPVALQERSVRLDSAVLDRPAAPDAVEIPDDLTSTSQEPFVWTKQWYPVSIVEALNPKKPNALHLLGKELVAWRTDEGEWVCMDDQCSHRLAPLSEGRVENNNIMCAYHAWSFSSEGKLVDVPQAHHSGDPDGNARACASRRGCVATYPVMIAQEMLFVWPESGAMAALEAANKEPVLSPHMTRQAPYKGMAGEPVYTVGKSFQRDQPLSWEFIMENLCDPAHFNPSHSEVAGDRRNEYTGMARIKELPEGLKVADLFNGAEGVGGLVTMLPGKGRTVDTAQHHVAMPGCFTLFYREPKDIPGAAFELLHIHVTPTKPGHTRIMVHFYMAGKKVPLPLKVFPKLVPAWFGHLQGLEITDGDNTFLIAQDRKTRELEQNHGQPWYKSYYMPTGSDRMIAQMRKWADTRGGGGPFPNAGPSAPISKDQAIDRLHQHTLSCPSCSVAYRNFRILRVVLAVAAGAFMAASMSTAVLSSFSMRAPALFAAAALACGALAAVANNFVRLLTFKPYEHYKH